MSEKRGPGKPFPKGVSGNPGGRPQLSSEEKLLRRLSKEQLVEIGSMLVQGKMSEIKKVYNEDSSGLRAVMASAILRAYDEGDWATLDKILDRLVGKVTDNVSVDMKTKVMQILRPDGSGVRIETNSGED